MRTTLHKVGACSKCGNKRMRNLTVMNEIENAQIKEWGFVDFANEYEVVADE